MNEGLSRLVRAMDGKRAVAERINALRDRFNAENQVALTERNMNAWHANFPMMWRQWLLAAAMDMGMPVDQAVAICPDLKPAACFALFLHHKLEKQRIQMDD
jgi:hypothetical protein